jgi:alkylation response protein AidB-like acyl-CoA dehydrogenase
MDDTAYEAFKNELFTAIWRDLDPLEEEIENTESLPYDRLMPLLRGMRAFGLIIPEEYGGVGLSMAQYLPILGEFAKIQGGIRVVVHVHNSMAHALWELGSEEQRMAPTPSPSL